MKRVSYSDAIARLFSLVDRNPDSPTYGCFDRQYWKYKVADFSNARMQEAALSLAMAYKETSDPRLKELAEAAIRFWTKVQNKNGSFNEYMPKENSHVATAFSTFAVSEVCRILGLKDHKIAMALKKAGEWLSKNKDIDVANHDAGAAAALLSIYKLTNDGKFLGYAKEKMRLVLRLQDKEGWFSEYGGADIGYQSFSIYYLAYYWKETGDKEVFESLKRAIEFFSYFIHPDYSIGGIYGNRETSLVLPAGFAILSGQIKLCGPILDAINKGISDNRLPSPSVFDDRFLCESLYPFMILTKAVKTTAKLPKDMEDFRKLFDNAGLLVEKKGNIFIVISLRKGGIVNAFYLDKQVFKDSGWIIGDATTAGKSEFSVVNSVIVVSGYLTKVKKMMQDTRKLMLMRTAGMLGMSPVVKSKARKHLIKKEKRLNIKFIRKIRISKDEIEISDSFDKQVHDPILTSSFHHVFSTSTGLYKSDIDVRCKLSGEIKNIVIKISKGKVVIK
ncbi:MAG: hypothetical protein ACE5J7_04815 [Candidatus Aenigmatarchaeota archaeon]